MVPKIYGDTSKIHGEPERCRSFQKSTGHGPKNSRDSEKFTRGKNSRGGFAGGLAAPRSRGIQVPPGGIFRRSRFFWLLAGFLYVSGIIILL